MASIPTISALLVVVGLLYKLVIYPYWLSPLAKIPNAHFTTPVSGLWILWARYRAREVSTINRAHEKCGEVVRLGPNELSVNCIEDGIRTIYVGGFDKHEFYANLFPNYGVPNMFASTHSKPHSIRKRMLSNVYSKSNIQSSQTNAAVSRAVIYDRLLPIIFEAAETNPKDVEMWSLMNSATMDLVTGFIFGQRQGTNFLQDDKTARWYLGAFQSRKWFQFWAGELPTLVGFTAKYLKCLLPKDVIKCNEQLEEMFLEICDKADEACVSSEDLRAENIPVVFKQLKTAIAIENEKKVLQPYDGDISRLSNPRISIASEVLDNSAAGQETSAITLTYIFWELSRNPKRQGQLREELLTLSPPIIVPQKREAALNLPSPRSIDALPLLHAILMETLRRYPAIPGPQPRLTPANSKTGTRIGAYDNIPANVRVSAQPFSLHRNAEVFPSPLEWQPDRWLEGKGTSPEQRAEMHRWFWAFGSGGRMCIGSNLAMQGMKLIIGAIMTNFSVSIVDDAGIDQEDTYVAKPKGEKLMLRFEEATGKSRR